MKIVEINSCNYGSTGKIMCYIAEVMMKDNHDIYVSFANSRSNNIKRIKNHILIGSILERNIHVMISKITGYNGCFSHIGTYKFIRKLKKIKPDLIHMHNLHNCYVNLQMLFRYIKKHNIKVVWTLHDCWSFTGQCPHFTGSKCTKWKNGCFKCPTFREYPKSYVDRTKNMYELKKKWFTGVTGLTIVAPSEWLAGLVKESFLKEYNVKVINNGIDLSIFKPSESDLRKQLNLEKKYVLLGVAYPFTNKKGLDVFLELANRLNKDYKIVLVGLTKEQISELPDNLIGIERTSSQAELAEFYTMADVFINPTKEDTFPTVNLEALACGTPVVTFRTGGSPEVIDNTCGSVVEYEDVDGMQKEILHICSRRPYSKDNCIKRAKQYDMYDKFKEYINLYEEVTKL